MDFQHMLSKAAPLDQEDSIWNRIKQKVISGTPIPYNLAFGDPNPETFPFYEGKVTLNDGLTFDIDPELMSTINRYGHLKGYGPLVRYFKDLTLKVHNPPLWEKRDIVITTGSLDALGKIFQMYLNEGDTLFVPQYTYHGIFAASQRLLPNYVTIENDDEGILPSSLQEALVRYKGSKNTPKILYVNPCGNNPTGSLMGEERRRAIYDLACKYDIIIAEDDAYYFLQFSDDPPPSFLQLDVEGRVIRVDSLSKTVSAGMRVAYVIAPKPAVEILVQMIYGTYMTSSLLTQAMISRLLDEWGIEKYLTNVKKTRDFYRRQRDFTQRAAEKHLKGLCEWKEPEGGMFLWLKVLGIKNTYNLLYHCGKDRGVMFVPGCAFQPDNSIPTQNVRVSYANTTEEEVNKAFKIFAEAIREELQKGPS